MVAFVALILSVMLTAAPLLDPEVEPFQKPEALARRWSLNRKTVLSAIRDEQIPAVRVGTRLLIPTAWVLDQERVRQAVS
jgi:hypothetical protein